MSLDLLILIICSAAIAALGLIIFARNPSSGDGQRFGFLSISLILWIIFNYLSENAASNNLLYTRLTFLGGVIAIYSVILFISHYPNEDIYKKSILLKLLTIFTVILVPIVFLPAFVVSIGENIQSNAITTSYLYYIFIAYIIYAITLLAIFIRGQTKNVKSKAQKEQLLIVAGGFILYAILALASNVVLPMFIDSWASSRLGPVFTLILVGVVSYGIIKHHLFDVRLVVARSVAYSLSIILIVLLYSILAFGIASVVFKVDITLQQEIFFAIFSAITALVFQPLKEFFDKLTNRIFYRDAYNAQEFLNDINTKIVNTVDLYELLSGSAKIISDNLRVEFCDFYIDEKSSIDFHVAGTDPKVFGQSGWEQLDELIDKSNQKVFTSGEEIDEKNSDLMRKLKIEVIIKMVSQEQHVGYLIIGQKKSGNATTDQDVQLLEIVADELAIAVQNSLRFIEIAQFNITLQKKVEIATAELQKSNEKLKALDEAKDEFISMASHQLRTPLTSVKGYISMLQEGDAGEVNEQQQNFLNQAFLSSQRMVYLIADLLNVSRLKTGKFVIEAKPTYLPDVVESEIAQLTETVKARDLEMKFDKPAEFPMLNLDETKTRQVIMNFADNAIYYTPNGGLITIKLEATKDTVEFTVTDTGIGVPKSEQHKLFTKFYRAGNARKARPDGTGLGLFMAKKVIIAEGGALIFKTQEGKGSTFGFSFPRSKLEVKQ